MKKEMNEIEQIRQLARDAFIFFYLKDEYEVPPDVKTE